MQLLLLLSTYSLTLTIFNLPNNFLIQSLIFLLCPLLFASYNKNFSLTIGLSFFFLLFSYFFLKVDTKYILLTILIFYLCNFKINKIKNINRYLFLFQIVFIFYIFIFFQNEKVLNEISIVVI